MTVTDAEHLDQARRLRDGFARPRGHVDEDVLVRDLADYDRAFGLHDSGQVA